MKIFIYLVAFITKGASTSDVRIWWGEGVILESRKLKIFKIHLVSLCRNAEGRGGEGGWVG